jgi:hypothetical protein
MFLMPLVPVARGNKMARGTGLGGQSPTHKLGWTPRLRQSVKPHCAVRCKSIVRRGSGLRAWLRLGKRTRALLESNPLGIPSWRLIRAMSGGAVAGSRPSCARLMPGKPCSKFRAMRLSPGRSRAGTASSGEIPLPGPLRRSQRSGSTGISGFGRDR